MYYELSVYLLNGFRGLFLGAISGPSVAALLYLLVSLFSRQAAFVRGDDLPNWAGYGLLLGTVTGLGLGLTLAHRRLLQERRDEREARAMSAAAVWPPELKHPAVKANSGGILKASGYALVLIGCVVGTVALLGEAYLLWGFYQDARRLTPGTPIRPMGLTFAMGIVATWAFLLGLPFSGFGLYGSILNRKRNGIICGVIGILLSLTLFPISSALFQGIADVQGLFLEP